MKSIAHIILRDGDMVREAKGVRITEVRVGAYGTVHVYAEVSSRKGGAGVSIGSITDRDAPAHDWSLSKTLTEHSANPPSSLS